MKHKTIDVLALGELLIDFTPSGLTAEGQALYAQNPGGAPANVLSFLARQNRKTALISQVGADFFGQSLAATLRELKIDCSGLVFAPDYLTTLAFVHLDKDGERSFTFYRQPGADRMLSPDSVKPDLLARTRIFHFGSVSLSAQPARTATLTAIRLAEEAGALISCDVNFRPLLWADHSEVRPVLDQALRAVSVLKVSQSELDLLTAGGDILTRGRELLERYRLKLLLITCGAAGSIALTAAGYIKQPAYLIKAVDTTGAGDAFCGAMLDRMLACPDGFNPPFETLKSWLSYANAAGALVATKKGALLAMPGRLQIKQFQETATFRDDLS